jgi:hypothetical protein
VAGTKARTKGTQEIKEYYTVNEFKQDADGVYSCQDAAVAFFPITVERHDRERFQREGHFVPRMLDEEQEPREWDGPNVFAGELWWEQKDVDGNVTARKQILRVLADTPKELLRLMDLRIRETFFALFLAQQLQTNDQSELKRLIDENNILRTSLLARIRLAMQRKIRVLLRGKQ